MGIKRFTLEKKAQIKDFQNSLLLVRIGKQR